MFSTPDGQRVLEHLSKVYSENTTLPQTEGIALTAELSYALGQRDVVNKINKLITTGEKENE